MRLGKRTRIKRTTEGQAVLIHIIKVVKLAVQSRRREGHRIFVLFKDVNGVPPDLFGVMGADTDTFTAVNTELPCDHSFSVADTDRLGWTALNTVDASHT